jgi:hypothetical protein
MSTIPYEDFGMDIKEETAEPTKHKERFYRHQLLTLFYAANLDLRAEVHGNLGRSVLEFVFEGQAWVFELKISYNEKDDSRLAETALNQIIEKNYAGKYQNPVLLGMAINDKARKITAWKCQGGVFNNPNDAAAWAKKQDSVNGD